MEIAEKANRRYQAYSKHLKELLEHFYGIHYVGSLELKAEIAKALSCSLKDPAVTVDDNLKCQVLLARAESEFKLAEGLAEVSMSEEANNVAREVHLTQASDFCQEVSNILENYASNSLDYSDFLGHSFLEDSLHCATSCWEFHTNRAFHALLTYKVLRLKELSSHRLHFDMLYYDEEGGNVSQETLEEIYQRLKPSLVILKLNIASLVALNGKSSLEGIPDEIKRNKLNVEIEILEEMAKQEMIRGAVLEAEGHPTDEKYLAQLVKPKHCLS